MLACPMISSVWWLYLIENAYGQLYTGITTDVERRLKEHQAGAPRGARALRGKGPLQLRYCCLVGEQRLALRVERVIKRLPRARKLALVNGNLAFDDILALVKSRSSDQ